MNALPDIYFVNFITYIYMNPDVNFKTADKTIVHENEFLVINFTGAAIGYHNNFLSNCISKRG